MAAGKSLEQIRSEMESVAEGVDTTRAALDLAETLGVEMPITQATYSIMFGGVSVSQAVRDLMDASLRQSSYLPGVHNAGASSDCSDAGCSPGVQRPDPDSTLPCTCWPSGVQIGAPTSPSSPCSICSRSITSSGMSPCGMLVEVAQTHAVDQSGEYRRLVVLWSRYVRRAALVPELYDSGPLK